MVLRGIACLAGLGSAYAFVAMFTQAMLGGPSEAEVWWDRVYIWWIDFLAVGLLLMLAIYLWRRSTRSPESETSRRSRGAWRVVLFPLGHSLLTGCLYFADLGSYLAEQANNQGSGSAPSIYFAIAVALAVGAAGAFWFASRLKAPQNQFGSFAG
jgi:hypothetical protein